MSYPAPPPAGSLSTKTLATLVSCLALGLLLHRVILIPLERNAIRMALLDPTEIIAEPVELRQVTNFVAASAATILATSAVAMVADSGKASLVAHVAISRIISMLIGTLFASIPVFFLGILLGAAPTENVARTLSASAYLSTLAFGPPLARYGLLGLRRHFVRFLVGPAPSTVQQFWPGKILTLSPALETLSLSMAPLSPPEFVERCSMYGTFVGIVPFSILLVLDHGLQIQRWPVPVFLGGFVGYSVGAVIAVALCGLGRFIQCKERRPFPTNDDGATKYL